MIRGSVNARRDAVVRIRVRGPAGAVVNLDAIVDTGFSGSLTLPLPTVTALGLIRQSGGRAVLADGSAHQFDVYGADVEWHGAWRPVLVSAVGGEALLGMRLLAGSELRVEVVPGGAVDVIPFP